MTAMMHGQFNGFLNGAGSGWGTYPGLLGYLPDDGISLRA
jgi:hypothetical protein